LFDILIRRLKEETERIHCKHSDNIELGKGENDMPYSRASTPRNLDKLEDWANRRLPVRNRKVQTWARLTPHSSTDWEQTAALLKSSWGSLLWVQNECESAWGTTTIMEPNFSHQWREEQGSKETLQPGRFKNWPQTFPPPGGGSAAVE